MPKQTLKKQPAPETDGSAEAREANKNLYRPGAYQDEEGHRRMMDALGIEMGTGHASPAGLGRLEEDRKWPLYKTFTLVVVANLLAWAGLIAVLDAIF